MESLNGLDIIINARDNATQILQTLQQRVEAFGTELSSRSAKINASLERVNQTLFTMKAAVTTVLMAFASGALVRTANQFDKFEASLQTVTGSAGKAKEAMSWITEFAAKTPYELSEVTQAFISLATRGFDAKKVLGTIGDTAAAFNRPLQDAVEAFTDAATGEFERLKAFGIQASVAGDQVTFKWQKNGQELQKTVSKTSTQITKALAEIWSGNYAGGMDNLSQQVGGMFSNLLDMFTSFQNAVMKEGGVWDWIKTKLKGVLEALGKLKAQGKLDEYAKDVGAAIRTALDVVWSFGEKLVAAGKIVYAVVKELVGYLDYIPVSFKEIIAWSALVAAALGTLGAALLVFKPVLMGLGAVKTLIPLFQNFIATLLSLTPPLDAARQGITTFIGLLRTASVGPLAAFAAAAIFCGTALYTFVKAVHDAHTAEDYANKVTAKATELRKKADESYKKLAASMGYAVANEEEFRKGVADGTIKLKGHAKQVALTADAYDDVQAAMGKAKTDGEAFITQVAERYDQQAKEARKLAATEGAAAADGLAAQRDKYTAVLAAAQDVYQQQIDYIKQVGGTEAQQADLRKKVEENLQAAKKAALTDWLSALKSGLDEALSQEKRYAQESENATKTTEDKVRALKRQTMDAEYAYYDQVAEANEKLSKAQQEAASGSAEGMDKAMEYAKAAQDAFVSAASSGKEVVGSYEAVQTAVEGVSKAGQVWADAADAGKAAWANTVEVFKNQIADAKAALEDLKNNPVTAKVSCDTTAVDQALDALRSTKTTSTHTVDPQTSDALKAIAELKKPTSSTHTVYIQEVTQKASGGPVRDVPVMAMPGEVVVEPERAGRLGPLLNAINTLRLPVDAILHRATGGGVFRPFLSGLIPGSGDEDSEPLLLRQGSFVVRKSAVQRYGADFINALGYGIPVPRFATGGLVLPDWLRRLTGRPEPTTTAAAPAASPVVAVPEASAPLQALEKPLAGRRKMSSTGTAALGRLNALRGKGLSAFSSGGDLDETLADIALERKRTQEDYESDIADAQTDHDDQLADLLKQEQSDLDDIAQTLADTLADLQKTWQAAQKTYAKDMAEAKSALQKAEREWYEWTYNADISYTAKNNEGDTVLYSQKQVDNNYSSKAKGGFVNALRDLQHFAAGGVSRWYKWTYSDGYMMPAKSRLVHFIDYSETAKEKNASLHEAIESAQEKINEVQETYNEAQGTYSSGVAEARGTAQDDTSSTKAQFQDDAADLDAELADKLEDLKTAYDRTMEDLDIKEARARADAEETGDYEISGFSSWLADGGPVKALGRIRRFAEGGLVRLLHRLPRFSDGGTVPLVEGAERGVDSVIAALTPGEGVINLKAMGQVISKRALAALNNLDLDGFLGELPRFADGGVVGAGRAASGLTPTNAAATDGYSATLNLNLGGRTYETRTSRATAAELARELRRQGVNVKS